MNNKCDTMADYWKDVKLTYKAEHNKRVSKTPERIEFCKDEFIKNEIYAELKERRTGQFNIKKGKNLIVFYCSTGRILLNNKSLEQRGIANCIRIIKNIEEVKDE